MKELREKEKEIEKDLFDVIKIEARYMTVNDLYELWKQVKRGLQKTILRSIRAWTMCWMFCQDAVASIFVP